MSFFCVLFLYLISVSYFCEVSTFIIPNFKRNNQGPEKGLMTGWGLSPESRNNPVDSHQLWKKEPQLRRYVGWRGEAWERTLGRAQKRIGQWKGQKMRKNSVTHEDDTLKLLCSDRIIFQFFCNKFILYKKH